MSRQLPAAQGRIGSASEDRARTLAPAATRFAHRRCHRFRRYRPHGMPVMHRRTDRARTGDELGDARRLGSLRIEIAPNGEMPRPHGDLCGGEKSLVYSMMARQAPRVLQFIALDLALCVMPADHEAEIRFVV